MPKLKLLQFAKQYNLNVRQVRPFVFATDTESLNKRVNVLPANNEIIAAPFEQFSIEFEHPKQSLMALDEAGSKLYYMVVICKELTPGQYEFDAWVKNARGDTAIQTVNAQNSKRGTSGHSMYDGLVTIVNQKLNQMRQRHAGEVSTSQSVKYKSATGQRTEYKPRSYIYVSNTDRRSERPSQSPRKNIRWVESYEVKAHWRRLSNAQSLGKDRAGNRVVPGYTFVKEYAKGKDRDNAIVKPRVVKALT